MHDYDDGRVDITKLTYSSNYKSYLNRKDFAAGYLQYLRFAAIIALLESMALDSLAHENQSWLVGASLCIILGIPFGKKAVGSHVKSMLLFLLATCVSLGVYYSKY